VHYLETDTQHPDQDLDLVLSNEMRQYYADADRHASQSRGSLIEIDNFGQATGSIPPNDTSNPFKALVQRNTLLEEKLEKMMAIVESLQSSPTQTSQSSN